MKLFVRLAVVICIFYSLQSTAQEKLKGTALLDKLMSDDNLEEAESTLNSFVSHFKKIQRYDSLSDYSYYVGAIELQKTNKERAQAKAEAYYENLKALTQDPATLRKACMSLASLYDRLGMPVMGLEINREALEHSARIPNATGRVYGVIHSNIGTSALRNGNISLAISEYRKTLSRYDTDTTTTSKDYYFGYSSMGAAMYYSSKIDSSIYYYQKAIDAVQKLDSSSVNLYYRPSLLYNNIAGLYSMEGNSNKALIAMKKALEFNEKFIYSGAENYKINDAKSGYYEAIENYAGIYQTLGDYKKAHDILLYAGELKRKNLPDFSPAIFKSKVLLGLSNINLRNYDKAAEQFDEAIERIKNNEGNFLVWNADAHYGRAQVYENEMNIEKATEYYKKTDVLFERSQGKTYDASYLSFLRNASLFYSKNNKHQEAIKTAAKAYEFILKSNGEESLTTLKEMLNMAEVHYNIEDYETSLRYSNKAIELINNTVNLEKNTSKGTRFLLLKPNAILLKNKTLFALNKNIDTAFLKGINTENEIAIKILAEQKNQITSPESIALLNEENTAVYSFAKKTASLLYEKTKDAKHLNKILELHEANLYSRIRTRLNGIDALKFSNVPDSILMNEKELKEKLNSFEDGFEDFIKTQEEWADFITTLKNKYPQYYKLRYGNETDNILKIQKALAPDQTAIRYLFIEHKLYVLVITSENFNFKKLDATNIEFLTENLQNESHDETKVANAAFLLYEKLWKPIEEIVTTSRVLIIPDGLLFNLSFETLTPKKLNSFEEFIDGSLLSKHAFSYNFSLQLVTPEENKNSYDKNFVGFAPGFSKALKEKYSETQPDSVSIDYEYMRLLPQPFSLDMVKSAKKLLGGSIFIETKASEENFINQAPNHKIIHIGTHAESNNISPELSRLVFAKSNSEDDNYLYNYEIYNTNLSSNIAVLTACETGKPSYQPGEGMISLAHAFNYAGSESMLTSLWKIDEKSSSEIIAYFYKNIEDGLSKDVALKRAKISYLENAEGRTLAPQYWGGLVLIGDTSAIKLSSSGIPLGVWISLGVVLFLLLFILRKKKTSNAS